MVSDSLRGPWHLRCIGGYFDGADPSKVDQNNMMLYQNPDGTSSVGYRDSSNGAFVPVYQPQNYGINASAGLYSGNNATGFSPNGYSDADIQQRMAAIFPNINQGYFKSQGDVDRIMQQIGAA